MVAALTASACGDDCTSAPPTTPTTASYAPAACPNPIYPGVPDLGPEFECGYLTVPENRSKAGSRTIRLAVARRKASSPNPKADPVVFLDGGPGGSGIADHHLVEEWHRDREVIILAERGTMKSEPFLSCPEIDQFTEQAVSLAWNAPATAEQSGAAVRACRERLAAAGWDLSAYNTTENAADLADLRVALGIREWNLDGLSYGSDLVLQTLRDHPAGIRSIIVDAVVPPQVNVIEQMWKGAAESYKAMFDACAADAACNTAYPNLQAEFTRLVNDLAENPRTISVPDPKTGQNTDVVIDGFKLASSVNYWTLIPPRLTQVPLLIHDLATGDGTQTAAAILGDVFPPLFDSYGLQWGVLCSEWVPNTSVESVKAVGKQALPDFPDSVLSMVPQFPWVFSDCSQWDVPPADQHVATPTESDIPALLTSGEFDGTAPPSRAETAANTLPNSRQFVFPYAGHGATSFRPTCFATIQSSFLNQLNNIDDSCLHSSPTPPFETP
jgi:pimeloyl-ACP methyl ester carboxylesterase